MFEKINEDLKLTMKSGDKFKLSVLRMIKSALLLELKNNKELNDSLVIAVLKKQVKQRNDSLNEYEKLGKIEVASDLKKEIEIIKEYLPEEASVEDIEKIVDEAFNELKPESMKQMGSIMNYVTEHLSNADMSVVSKIVKERLQK